MSSREDTEIRFMAPAADVCVLDGYCHATGAARTDVMQAVLHEWAGRQLHIATVVLRTSRGNPDVAATDRKEGGK